MPKTTLAHFTDAHLGQKLVTREGGTVDTIRYTDDPTAHWHHLRLVLDDIASRGISDVVFGGDIGTRDAVPGFFALLDDYGLKASIVPGNHDDYRSIAQYRGVDTGAVPGKLCSSREEDHWKYIYLDSSDNTIGSRQLGWLERELEGAVKVILLVHHPILAIDTPVERAGAALRDRHETNAVLAKAKCDVSIFCGHYHMIDEARHANIRQFVTPAVSYQIVKQSEQIRLDTSMVGYRILEIEDAEIRTRTVMLTSI